MAKIIKNLSDAEMFKNFKEELTFEHTDRDDFAAPKTPKQPKEPEREPETSYLSRDLAEQLDKILLELKVKLYKEGIVDYKMKVSREDNKIILSPVPFTPKPVKEVGLSSASEIRRPEKRR